MLTGSPKKFLTTISAGALDVFKFSISLFNSFLLGFIGFGFRWVFMMKRLDRFRSRSKHFECKSFLGRVGLSRDWNSQSTDDRNIIVNVGAEI